MPSKLLGCIGFLHKVLHKTGRFSAFIFTFSFPFNFRTANALVLKFSTLPLGCLFSNTLLAIFDILIRLRVIHRFVSKNWPKLTCGRVFQHNSISKANFKNPEQGFFSSQIFTFLGTFNKVIQLFKKYAKTFYFRQAFTQNPNLRPRRRPDLEHTDIECITLELQLGTVKLSR